jgi:hypothetical protein
MHQHLAGHVAALHRALKLCSGDSTRQFSFTIGPGMPLKSEGNSASVTLQGLSKVLKS